MALYKTKSDQQQQQQQQIETIKAFTLKPLCPLILYLEKYSFYHATFNEHCISI